MELNHQPTPEELTQAGFDAVLAATGSVAKLPPHRRDAPAGRQRRSPTCHDVIGREETLGKHIIMVGCSETGIETACYLAQNGHQVTCLTRQNVLASDASRCTASPSPGSNTTRRPSRGMAPIGSTLRGSGASPTPPPFGQPHSATYLDENGTEHTVEGDSVVVCGGVEPCLEGCPAVCHRGPGVLYDWGCGRRQRYPDRHPQRLCRGQSAVITDSNKNTPRRGKLRAGGVFRHKERRTAELRCASGTLRLEGNVMLRRCCRRRSRCAWRPEQS